MPRQIIDPMRATAHIMASDVAMITRALDVWNRADDGWSASDSSLMSKLLPIR